MAVRGEVMPAPKPGPGKKQSPAKKPAGPKAPAKGSPAAGPEFPKRGSKRDAGKLFPGSY